MPTPSPLTIGESTWLKIQAGALWVGIGVLGAGIWWVRGFVADNHDFQDGTTKTMSAIVTRIDANEVRAQKSEDARQIRYQDYLVEKERVTNNLATLQRSSITEEDSARIADNRRNQQESEIQAMRNDLAQHVADHSIHMNAEARFAAFVTRSEFMTETEKMNAILQRILAGDIHQKPANE